MASRDGLRPQPTGSSTPAPRGAGRGRYRVALVMIVRDEERCLHRALTSVRPWVDDMVVVDTGSLDATTEIAARCGAQVHRMIWPEDFAAARNAALELADADWNLILDADEWVSGGGPWLRDVATEEPCRVGLTRVQSAFWADGREGVSSNTSPRVLPRGVRYQGEIHELPVHDLPVFTAPMVISHDGYTLEQAKRKESRNVTLLQRRLARDPGDAYTWFQLARQHEMQERLADAASCYRKAYQLGADGQAWRHPLVVQLLSALGRSGDLAGTLELLGAEERSWASSPDFHFAAGNALLDLGLNDPTVAPRLLPYVERYWARCLTIGERPQLEGAVAGRGSYLAAHNLAALHESLGNGAAAQDYRSLAQRLTATMATTATAGRTDLP